MVNVEDVVTCVQFSLVAVMPDGIIYGIVQSSVKPYHIKSCLPVPRQN